MCVGVAVAVGWSHEGSSLSTLSQHAVLPESLVLFAGIARVNIVDARKRMNYCSRLIIETKRRPWVSLPLASNSLMKRYPDARRSRRIHAQPANGSRLIYLNGASSSILNLNIDMLVSKGSFDIAH